MTTSVDVGAGADIDDAIQMMWVFHDLPTGTSQTVGFEARVAHSNTVFLGECMTAGDVPTIAMTTPFDANGQAE